MKAAIAQTPTYSFKMLLHFLTSNSSYDEIKITYSLSDFKCRFGNDAISDLHGFWLVKANFRVPNHEIIEMIVSDLALEPGSIPQSFGYRNSLTDDPEGEYK